jgi:hypothetical protein
VKLVGFKNQEVYLNVTVVCRDSFQCKAKIYVQNVQLVNMLLDKVKQTIAIHVVQVRTPTKKVNPFVKIVQLEDTNKVLM